MKAELITNATFLDAKASAKLTESGIDTSLLVKAQDFELLELIVSELDREIEDYALNYERKLAEKEDRYRVISESGENITLQSSVEYRLGLRTSLNLILPTVIPDEFECIVSFRTGENGIEFTCDGVIMTQDDCYQGVFTPCKNRIYEINIKNVEGTLIGKIGTCDYIAN